VADDCEAVVPRGMRLLRQRPKQGPAAARNLGARNAAGTWLAFLDDDCVPDRGWLRGLEAVLEDENVMAGGMVRNALTANPYATATQAIIDYFYSGEPSFFTSNNLAVDAARFRSMGGFDSTWPLAAAEDREFCARWIAFGGCLRYAPHAEVRHAHDLSRASFCKQHFRYGRGACWLRRKHPSIPAGTAGAWRYAARRAQPALVALAQSASAAGYLREKLWPTQVAAQLADGPRHDEDGDHRKDLEKPPA
jgi:GT2 family glycosyltransferase